MNHPPAPPDQLPRVLGPWMAAAVVVGTVIGSGVFKKAQVIATNVPDFGLVMAAWVLGGVMTLLGALALAEVAALFPRAGGAYVFMREAYGRGWGFLWGWVEFMIIRPASIAALATVFSQSVHDILKQTMSESRADVLDFWPLQLLTVSVIFALAAVNARGTKIGGGVQLVITAVKVLSLLGIIVLPFVVLALVSEPRVRPDPARLDPVWPDDWAAVKWGLFGSALIGVLWAYDGWINIGPIGGEVKNPQRNLPLALLGGVAALIALYVGANVAYYLVIPRDEIAAAKDTTVAAEFCLRLLGPVGGLVASSAVMISVFGALNGNLLVGPRLLYAMGEDGLAPRKLRELHPRYQTPALAIGVLAVWASLLVLCSALLTRTELPTLDLAGRTIDLNLLHGKPLFDVVTDFAIFGSVTFETLAVGSVFVFRRTLPDAPRMYRCVGYPVVPVLYVLIKLAVIGNMFVTPDQRGEAVIGAGFIAAGAAVYGLFLRRRG